MNFLVVGYRGDRGAGGIPFISRGAPLMNGLEIHLELRFEGTLGLLYIIIINYARISALVP